MGRSSRREHLGPPHKDQEGADRKGYTAEPLCGGGEDRWGSGVYTRAPSPDADTTCPTCQALHYRAVLAEQFPTLSLVKIAPTRGYRGVQEIRIGGVLRGYVCTESGWGAGYTVHAVENNYDTGAVQVAYGDHELPTGRYYLGSLPRNMGETIIVRRSKFGSKEHAAYAMALYTLGRALAGWSEFEPPMEPEAFLAKQSRDRQARADQKEERRRSAIAFNTQRESDYADEITKVQAHMNKLRGINAVDDAMAEALAWAQERGAARIAELEGAIRGAREIRTRAEEGRLEL